MECDKVGEGLATRSHFGPGPVEDDLGWPRAVEEVAGHCVRVRADVAQREQVAFREFWESHVTREVVGGVRRVPADVGGKIDYDGVSGESLDAVAVVVDARHDDVADRAVDP